MRPEHPRPSRAKLREARNTVTILKECERLGILTEQQRAVLREQESWLARWRKHTEEEEPD